jgi:AraC family transcriptional regulator
MPLHNGGAHTATGHSSPTLVAGFKPERMMQFRRGWVEARNYHWDGTFEWTADQDAYWFNLALAPRPASASMTYVSAGRRGPPLGPGRAIMVPPGQTVRATVEASRYRTVDCVVDACVLDEVLGRPPEWEPELLPQTACLGREVEWLLLKMYQELRQCAFGAPIKIEALASALAVEVIRGLALDRRAARPSRGGLAPWRMRILRDRIHADGPAPTLSELSELCDMSVRHLCRTFKTETGETIGQYVEGALLERAWVLLAKPEASVRDVARSLGFADTPSFAHAFRRATGLRPSEARGAR